MKNNNDQKPIEVEKIIKEQIKKRNQVARHLMWRSFLMNSVSR